MSDPYDLDLVVIGAGTGGVSVARACASEGWAVAMVDELPYGGTSSSATSPRGRALRR